MGTVELTRVTRSVTLIVDRSYWTEERLIDELFLRLATTANNKYYNQALTLRKWIPIAKPPPEFIVNMSDLTPRLIAELQAIDDSYTIVKLAVGRIFENIDSDQYHLSIASKLKVRVVVE
jgi:hypothetical protein